MRTISLPFRRFPSLIIRHHWLADRPSAGHAAGFHSYFNCDSAQDHLGLLRLPKRRLELRLEGNSEDLLAQCKSDTRYEIRRAMRDGIISNIESDEHFFSGYYSEFAKSKGLNDLDPFQLSAYWPFLTTTKAIFEDTVLAMHVWIIDQQAAMATMVYSCSLYRDIKENPAFSQLHGRANRFLHWDDFRRFGDIGVTRFDFGCFNDASTLENVNAFKSSFPVNERPCSYYMSYPLWMVNQLSRFYWRRSN